MPACSSALSCPPLAAPPPPSNDELEHQITELSANINAASYRLLSLIGEFDRREAWGGWGLNSCAHWLNWQCGIALGAAREKVRVARALQDLAKISETFAAGELSYSKVRAMTRIATPENEDYLLMIARHGTATHVETLVRKYRGICRAAANRQHEARSLHYYWDDDASLVIKARLPAEQGAQVLKALDAAADAFGEEEKEEQDVPAGTPFYREVAEDRDATDQQNVPAGTPFYREVPEDSDARNLNYPARRADALGLLAESFMATGPHCLHNADRYQVVVHVAEEALHNAEAAPRCELEAGPRIAPDSVRRLGCDASRVHILEDSQGTPLSVGRKTRAIPPALRRALQARDRGCRFPGCTATRFTDAHHIQHWADGGETSFDNLVLLCKHHHRKVHEGGFGLRPTHDGLLIFTRPDGRRIEAVPRHPPARQSVEQHNRARGLSIDATTGLSLWQGEVMDYGMGVEGLS